MRGRSSSTVQRAGKGVDGGCCTGHLKSGGGGCVRRRPNIHVVGGCSVRGRMCYFFFFSSRRRHTRFDCDWSSDVCSSDLSQAGCSEGAQRALGISPKRLWCGSPTTRWQACLCRKGSLLSVGPTLIGVDRPDRKSTRLNSSHSQISYAVFCLKKKKNIMNSITMSKISKTTSNKISHFINIKIRICHTIFCATMLIVPSSCLYPTTSSYSIVII